MFGLQFQEEVVPLLVIFFMAALLHHVVSSAGSLWHSIAVRGESKYAVFTFRDDLDLPMSKNVLMNLCIPNIAMIVIYMVAVKIKWEGILQYLWCFVFFYYLYRTILICVILRRKELYKVQYEIFMFICAVVIEYFLWNYFLNSEENLFVPIEELRNEIWLIILVIVYKFIEMIIDKIAHQKNIVTEPMMNRYLIKKFKEFHKKYSASLPVDYDNRIVCILLYSIMIFEHFNRSGISRLLEKVKIFFGKTATVGIMQVTSDKYLSNEESIIVAYNMLEKDIFVEDKQIEDDDQIRWYAWQYNHDDDYAKSVVFIYRHLKEYLEASPRYRNEFCLDERKEKCEEDTSVVEADELDAQPQEYISWITIGDVEQMTGLKKKEILKIQRKNNAIILFSEKEVKENFKNYLEKVEDIS